METNTSTSCNSLFDALWAIRCNSLQDISILVLGKALSIKFVTNISGGATWIPTRESSHPRFGFIWNYINRVVLNQKGGSIWAYLCDVLVALRVFVQRKAQTLLVTLLFCQYACKGRLYVMVDVFHSTLHRVRCAMVWDVSWSSVIRRYTYLG